ncbi:hypothetical protein ILFOPFJJ_07060 [Ensifer psoraleae]|uniref:hypothetical protein n=1 Tax=Sinorhizobium psoraleae TaxID=520838 RepID=UPI001568993D|nr:hypothetical protein [Sinorhizobium psoraleae]NRP76136.1 hypothetical protein [Sinorhizobium psoraleae]
MDNVHFNYDYTTDFMTYYNGLREQQRMMQQPGKIPADEAGCAQQLSELHLSPAELSSPDTQPNRRRKVSSALTSAVRCGCCRSPVCGIICSAARAIA